MMRSDVQCSGARGWPMVTVTREKRPRRKGLSKARPAIREKKLPHNPCNSTGNTGTGRIDTSRPPACQRDGQTRPRPGTATSLMLQLACLSAGSLRHPVTRPPDTGRPGPACSVPWDRLRSSRTHFHHVALVGSTSRLPASGSRKVAWLGGSSDHPCPQLKFMRPFLAGIAPTWPLWQIDPARTPRSLHRLSPIIFNT